MQMSEFSSRELVMMISLNMFWRLTITDHPGIGRIINPHRPVSARLFCRIDTNNLKKKLKKYMKKLVFKFPQMDEIPN